MFIFTTKFNKKKAVIAVLILAAVLIAVIMIAGAVGRSSMTKAKETASLTAVVKNNDQRVNYLNSLGWEVDKNPIEEQKVVIPREFSDVYKNYNEIQQSQGFDLTRYGGIEAQRFTYKVLNYPGATGNVVADIIVYKNQIIAGDVQSNAFDGFMVGLKFPKQTPAPQSAMPSAAMPSAAMPSGAAPTAANPNAPAPDVSPNAVDPNAANPSAAKTDALISDTSAFEEMAET